MIEKRAAATAVAALGILLAWTSTADAALILPAPAQNPCSYSVNYFCHKTTGSNQRGSRTAVANGNYVRETSVYQIVKTAGAGGVTGPISWVTGTSNTVYLTWGRYREYFWCDSGSEGIAGIAVGCNYTS